jgi:hypothetical protein
MPRQISRPTTTALFAIDIFGGQWVKDGQLLMPFNDPITPDAFVIYTIKKAAYGSIEFTRHVVTIIEGEYTCNCKAYQFLRNRSDFTDKHIAAVLEAGQLQPEPAAIYQQWKKHND